jgi:hypothetical protein
MNNQLREFTLPVAVRGFGRNLHFWCSKREVLYIDFSLLEYVQEIST